MAASLDGAAALVEQGQARERRELLEEAGEERLLPGPADVAEERECHRQSRQSPTPPGRTCPPQLDRVTTQLADWRDRSGSHGPGASRPMFREWTSMRFSRSPRDAPSRLLASWPRQVRPPAASPARRGGPG